MRGPQTWHVQKTYPACFCENLIPQFEAECPVCGCFLAYRSEDDLNDAMFSHVQEKHGWFAQDEEPECSHSETMWRSQS